MADTSYGVNDAEAVKLWSKKLFRQSLKQTFLSRFMGEGTDNVIQIKDDTSKGMGDRVRVILRMQLSGSGVSGDGPLEGNEEALTTFTDDLFIDQLRHAVKSGGRMSEQRIPFSVRDEARSGLQDWWADRIDTALFNQLCGNNAQTDTSFTGGQAVTAPDNAHQLWDDDSAVSADESLTAAQTMTLTDIDRLVELAETADTQIRPLQISGEPWYVLFVHPYQAVDIRRSTTTNEWADIQKAAMNGGQVSGNPIFTGALGVYNQTIIHKATRVTLGVNSSTSAVVTGVRRAIFTGAQAGLVGFGRDNSMNAMTWVEELFDYKNQLGVSAGMVWGAKRTIFNSETFGSIVLSTAAAAH